MWSMEMELIARGADSVVVLAVRIVAVRVEGWASAEGARRPDGERRRVPAEEAAEVGGHAVLGFRGAVDVDGLHDSLGVAAASGDLGRDRAGRRVGVGDLEDDDETLLVTEYFAQQIAELQSDGLNADVNKAGIVYKAVEHPPTEAISAALIDTAGEA